MKTNFILKHHKTIIAITTIVLSVGFWAINQSVQSRANASIDNQTTPEYLTSQKYSQTTTPFSQEEITITEDIPYEVIYQKNVELELGVEEMIQEGENGQRRTVAN